MMSLADTFNLMLVVAAFAGLRFQARAHRLAEQGLKVKMSDMDAVIQRLESERRERLMQHEDLQHFDNYLFDYVSKGHESSDVLNSATRVVSDESISVIVKSLFVLNHPTTRSIDSPSEYEQRYAVVSRSMVAMLTMIQLRNNFHSDMNSAHAEWMRRKSELSRKGLSASEFETRLSEEVGRFSASLELINEDFTRTLLVPSQEWKAATTDLDALMRQISMAKAM